MPLEVLPPHPYLYLQVKVWLTVYGKKNGTTEITVQTLSFYTVSEDSNTAATVGGVLGALAIVTVTVIVIVVVVVLLRNCGRNQKYVPYIF